MLTNANRSIANNKDLLIFKSCPSQYSMTAGPTKAIITATIIVNKQIGILKMKIKSK